MGDRRGEAAQLLQLGNLYLRDERHAEGAEAYRQAEALLAEVEDDALRVSVMINLGLLAQDKGDFEEALDRLRLAMKLIDADAPESGLFVGVHIGTTLHLLKRYADAKVELTRVLRKSKDITLQRTEALALVGLADVLRSTGEYTEALEHGRRALGVARRFDLRATECVALNSVGEVTLAMGRWIVPVRCLSRRGSTLFATNSLGTRPVP
jgi:tetratricopeptide (TPR) repeat protein